MTLKGIKNQSSNIPSFKGSAARTCFFSPQTLAKIAKIAAIILLVSLVSITVVTLIIKYPTGSRIFYTVFSTTAAISLVTLALLYFSKKPCQRKTTQTLSSETPSPEVTPIPTTSANKLSTNPFEDPEYNKK